MNGNFEKTITHSNENCRKHGPYTAEVITLKGLGIGGCKTKCPVCEDEQEQKRRADEVIELARIKVKQVASKRNAAGIPRRGFECSFDNFVVTTEEQKKALDTARSFAENFDSVLKTGSNLLFCGSPGTGKTHLAYSAANHLIPNRGVIYTTGYALVRSIRDTWRKDSDVSESVVVNRYARADLLIVDEVGAQFGSEGERVQLFDILDQRYQQMLPTLIITNLNLQELRDCLGDRSYDRLMEIGGSVVTFAGKSYRRNEELLRRAVQTADPPPLNPSERVTLESSDHLS